MSHSLRAKIKGLRYKGIITDKDCDRLCKALDNEGVLNKIRAEIEELDGKYVIGDYGTYGEHSPKYVRLMEVLQIIDKYKAESEETHIDI